MNYIFNKLSLCRVRFLRTSLKWCYENTISLNETNPVCIFLIAQYKVHIQKSCFIMEIENWFVDYPHYH